METLILKFRFVISCGLRIGYSQHQDFIYTRPPNKFRKIPMQASWVHGIKFPCSCSFVLTVHITMCKWGLALPRDVCWPPWPPSYCCFDSYSTPFFTSENNQSSPLTLVSRPTPPPNMKLARAGSHETDVLKCLRGNEKANNCFLLVLVSCWSFQVNRIFKESCRFIQVTLDCGSKTANTFTFRQHHFFSKLWSGLTGGSGTTLQL